MFKRGSHVRAAVSFKDRDINQFEFLAVRVSLPKTFPQFDPVSPVCGKTGIGDFFIYPITILHVIVGSNEGASDAVEQIRGKPGIIENSIDEVK
jgi:hypothetical protein